MWVLWVAAPLLLALDLVRPFTESRGLARTLPESLAGYTLAVDRQLTARQTELLGTEDAAWRTYEDGEGNRIFMVAVFHEENWKSVHPPRICIEGSDMTIEAEDTSPLPLDTGAAVAGRILAKSRARDLDYVSLYVYGAPGLLTPSYFEFFWHHAPLALFRRATSGFLLRVETYVGEGGPAAAEERCRRFLGKLVPAAQGLIAEPRGRG